MKRKSALKPRYVEVGVCGLSCRLCPAFNRETTSRCPGCKSEFRMGAPCPTAKCAVDKKGVEFCWECPQNAGCIRWQKHAEYGRAHDSFVCYQKLENNVSSITKNGIAVFEKDQQTREKLLRELLGEFNEGRSKSLYCIAATVLEIPELENLLEEARQKSLQMAVREKAALMHSLLDKISAEKGYVLKLRK
jgi:hypothetical protein